MHNDEIPLNLFEKIKHVTRRIIHNNDIQIQKYKEIYTISKHTTDPSSSRPAIFKAQLL